MVKKAVGYFIFMFLAIRCVIAAESGLNNYIGLRFSYLRLPQECKFDQFRFNNTKFNNQKSLLFVTEFKCSGRAQFWLSRAVDKDGKTIPYGHSFQLNEKKEFVVEDVYILRPLKKREELINGWCTRNGVEPGPDFSFAFAIGTTVPLHDGSQAVIGSRATRIAEAWKVNMSTRKFEKISTKGISCAFWD